ncbi:MAG TPA: hypothetical protein VLE43_09040 [Candidatus Saccharimonadia bacterium]|nr:hypothetical protein [Candidatus Saccharimonadia bacterium]
MDDVPKSKTRRRSRWLILSILLVLALICAPAAWRVYAVIGVQSVVPQADYINFGELRVERMPEYVEFPLRDFLKWTCAGKPESVRRAWFERFSAAYCGPITDIHVYSSAKLCGDLGAALLRFPGLRRVTIYGDGRYDYLTEEELRLLCERLRTMPALEYLELGGQMLTDDALLELAGHPKLQKLTISRCPRVSPEVLKVLLTLPALKEVSLHGGDVERISKDWNSPAKQASIRATFPDLTITYQP